VTGKWIITGGCGFVGSNLAAALLEDGVEVIAVDTLVRTGSGENLGWLRERAARPGSGRFTHVAADTRSQSDVEHVFARHAEGATAIAHVAGQVAMTTSIERPRYDFEVNVLGAMNVLEAIRAYAPQAVALFSSTNKVYGDLAQVRHAEAETRWTIPDHPHGLDEQVPLEFHSPYGCSKGAADQYFLDYHRIFGLKTVVFRHSSMYGGRQWATYDQGWVGWFCQQALRQRAEVDAGREPAPFTISGDGKQVRDLLFADDLVRCYRLAAARPETVAGRVYNIGGGIENSLSLLELFALLERKVGVALRYEKLPWRASDQRVFVADTRKARRDFGFEPRVGVEEGLGRTIEWLSRG
jgi:CDP-paratose 2-epimerase